MTPISCDNFETLLNKVGLRTRSLSYDTRGAETRGNFPELWSTNHRILSGSPRLLVNLPIGRHCSPVLGPRFVTELQFEPPYCAVCMTPLVKSPHPSSIFQAMTKCASFFLVFSMVYTLGFSPLVYYFLYSFTRKENLFYFPLYTIKSSDFATAFP